MERKSTTVRSGGPASLSAEKSFSKGPSYFKHSLGKFSSAEHFDLCGTYPTGEEEGTFIVHWISAVETFARQLVLASGDAFPCVLDRGARRGAGVAPDPNSRGGVNADSQAQSPRRNDTSGRASPSADATVDDTTATSTTMRPLSAPGDPLNRLPIGFEINDMSQSVRELPLATLMDATRSNKGGTARKSRETASSWSVVHETRTEIEQLLQPFAEAAYQRHIGSDAAVAASSTPHHGESVTPQLVVFNPNAAAGGCSSSGGGSTGKASTFGTTFVDVNAAVLVQLWPSDGSTNNAYRSLEHVQQVVWEYALEGIYAPHTTWYSMHGEYVSVTAVPPLVFGEFDEITVVPTDSASTVLVPQKATEVIQHSARALLQLVQLAVQRKRGDDGSMPTPSLRLRHGADGRWYLVDGIAVVHALLHTAFSDRFGSAVPLVPGHRLFERLVEANAWQPNDSSKAVATSSGAGGEIGLHDVVTQRLVPGALREVYAVIQRRDAAQQTVPALLRDQVLMNALRAFAVPMRYLFDVYCVAQQLQDWSSSELDKYLDASSSGIYDSTGAGDLGSQQDVRSARSQPQADASGSRPKPEAESFKAVMKLVADICLTEIAGRSVKDMTLFDLRQQASKGFIGEADQLEAINRVLRHVATKDADFFAGMLTPVARRKFAVASCVCASSRQKETFVLEPSRVHVASILKCVSSRTGATMLPETNRFEKFAPPKDTGVFTPLIESPFYSRAGGESHTASMLSPGQLLAQLERPTSSSSPVSPRPPQSLLGDARLARIALLTSLLSFAQPAEQSAVLAHIKGHPSFSASPFLRAKLAFFLMQHEGEGNPLRLMIQAVRSFQSAGSATVSPTRALPPSSFPKAEAVLSAPPHVLRLRMEHAIYVGLKRSLPLPLVALVSPWAAAMQGSPEVAAAGAAAAAPSTPRFLLALSLHELLLRFTKLAGRLPVAPAAELVEAAAAAAAAATAITTATPLGEILAFVESVVSVASRQKYSSLFAGEIAVKIMVALATSESTSRLFLLPDSNADTPQPDVDGPRLHCLVTLLRTLNIATQLVRTRRGPRHVLTIMLSYATAYTALHIARCASLVGISSAMPATVLSGIAAVKKILDKTLTATVKQQAASAQSSVVPPSILYKVHLLLTRILQEEEMLFCEPADPFGRFAGLHRTLGDASQSLKLFVEAFAPQVPAIHLLQRVCRSWVSRRFVDLQWRMSRRRHHHVEAATNLAGNDVNVSHLEADRAVPAASAAVDAAPVAVTPTASLVVQSNRTSSSSSPAYHQPTALTASTSSPVPRAPPTANSLSPENRSPTPCVEVHELRENPARGPSEGSQAGQHPQTTQWIAEERSVGRQSRASGGAPADRSESAPLLSNGVLLATSPQARLGKQPSLFFSSEGTLALETTMGDDSVFRKTTSSASSALAPVSIIEAPAWPTTSPSPTPSSRTSTSFSPYPQSASQTPVPGGHFRSPFDQSEYNARRHIRKEEIEARATLQFRKSELARHQARLLLQREIASLLERESRARDELSAVVDAWHVDVTKFLLSFWIKWYDVEEQRMICVSKEEPLARTAVVEAEASGFRFVLQMAERAKEAAGSRERFRVADELQRDTATISPMWDRERLLQGSPVLTPRSLAANVSPLAAAGGATPSQSHAQSQDLPRAPSPLIPAHAAAAAEPSSTTAGSLMLPDTPTISLVAVEPLPSAEVDQLVVAWRRERSASVSPSKVYEEANEVTNRLALLVAHAPLPDPRTEDVYASFIAAETYAQRTLSVLRVRSVSVAEGQAMAARAMGAQEATRQRLLSVGLAAVEESRGLTTNEHASVSVDVSTVSKRHTVHWWAQRRGARVYLRALRCLGNALRELNLPPDQFVTPVAVKASFCGSLATVTFYPGPVDHEDESASSVGHDGIDLTGASTAAASPSSMHLSRLTQAIQDALTEAFGSALSHAALAAMRVASSSTPRRGSGGADDHLVRFVPIGKSTGRVAVLPTPRLMQLCDDFPDGSNRATHVALASHLPDAFVFQGTDESKRLPHNVTRCAAALRSILAKKGAISTKQWLELLKKHSVPLANQWAVLQSDLLRDAQQQQMHPVPLKAMEHVLASAISTMVSRSLKQLVLTGLANANDMQRAASEAPGLDGSEQQADTSAKTFSLVAQILRTFTKSTTMLQTHLSTLLAEHFVAPLAMININLLSLSSVIREVGQFFGFAMSVDDQPSSGAPHDAFVLGFARSPVPLGVTFPRVLGMLTKRQRIPHRIDRHAEAQELTRSLLLLQANRAPRGAIFSVISRSMFCDATVALASPSVAAELAQFTEPQQLLLVRQHLQTTPSNSGSSSSGVSSSENSNVVGFLRHAQAAFFDDIHAVLSLDELVLLERLTEDYLHDELLSLQQQQQQQQQGHARRPPGPSNIALYRFAMLILEREQEGISFNSEPRRVEPILGLLVDIFSLRCADAAAPSAASTSTASSGSTPQFSLLLAQRELPLLLSLVRILSTESFIPEAVRIGFVRHVLLRVVEPALRQLLLQDASYATCSAFQPLAEAAMALILHVVTVRSRAFSDFTLEGGTTGAALATSAVKPFLEECCEAVFIEVLYASAKTASLVDDDVHQLSVITLVLQDLIATLIGSGAASAATSLSTPIAATVPAAVPLSTLAALLRLHDKARDFTSAVQSLVLFLLHNAPHVLPAVRLLQIFTDYGALPELNVAPQAIQQFAAAGAVWTWCPTTAFHPRPTDVFLELEVQAERRHVITLLLFSDAMDSLQLAHKRALLDIRTRDDQLRGDEARQRALELESLLAALIEDEAAARHTHEQSWGLAAANLFRSHRDALEWMSEKKHESRETEKLVADEAKFRGEIVRRSFEKLQKTFRAIRAVMELFDVEQTERENIWVEALQRMRNIKLTERDDAHWILSLELQPTFDGGADALPRSRNASSRGADDGFQEIVPGGYAENGPFAVTSRPGTGQQQRPGSGNRVPSRQQRVPTPGGSRTTVTPPTASQRASSTKSAGSTYLSAAAVGAGAAELETLFAGGMWQRLMTPLRVVGLVDEDDYLLPKPPLRLDDDDDDDDDDSASDAEDRSKPRGASPPSLPPYPFEDMSVRPIAPTQHKKRADRQSAAVTGTTAAAAVTTTALSAVAGTVQVGSRLSATSNAEDEVATALSEASRTAVAVGNSVAERVAPANGESLAKSTSSTSTANPNSGLPPLPGGRVSSAGARRLPLQPIGPIDARKLIPSEYTESYVDRLRQRAEEKGAFDRHWNNRGTQTGFTPPPTPPTPVSGLLPLVPAALSYERPGSASKRSVDDLESALDEAANTNGMGLMPALDILYRSTHQCHAMGEALVIVFFMDIESAANIEKLSPKKRQIRVPSAISRKRRAFQVSERLVDMDKKVQELLEESSHFKLLQCVNDETRCRAILDNEVEVTERQKLRETEESDRLLIEDREAEAKKAAAHCQPVTSSLDEAEGSGRSQPRRRSGATNADVDSQELLDLRRQVRAYMHNGPKALRPSVPGDGVLVLAEQKAKGKGGGVAAMMKKSLERANPVTDMLRKLQEELLALDPTGSSSTSLSTSNRMRALLPPIAPKAAESKPADALTDRTAAAPAASPVTAASGPPQRISSAGVRRSSHGPPTLPFEQRTKLTSSALPPIVAAVLPDRDFSKAEYSLPEKSSLEMIRTSRGAMLPQVAHSAVEIARMRQEAEREILREQLSDSVQIRGPPMLHESREFDPSRRGFALPPVLGRPSSMVHSRPSSASVKSTPVADLSRSLAAANHRSKATTLVQSALRAVASRDLRCKMAMFKILTWLQRMLRRIWVRRKCLATEKLLQRNLGSLAGRFFARWVAMRNERRGLGAVAADILWARVATRLYQKSQVVHLAARSQRLLLAQRFQTMQQHRHLRRAIRYVHCLELESQRRLLQRYFENAWYTLLIERTTQRARQVRHEEQRSPGDASSRIRWSSLPVADRLLRLDALRAIAARNKRTIRGSYLKKWFALYVQRAKRQEAQFQLEVLIREKRRSLIQKEVDRVWCLSMVHSGWARKYWKPVFVHLRDQVLAKHPHLADRRWKYPLPEHLRSVLTGGDQPAPVEGVVTSESPNIGDE